MDKIFHVCLFGFPSEDGLIAVQNLCSRHSRVTLKYLDGCPDDRIWKMCKRLGWTSFSFACDLHDCGSTIERMLEYCDAAIVVGNRKSLIEHIKAKCIPVRNL